MKRYKKPSKYARRTAIIGTYEALIKSNRVKEKGVASLRYDFLRLNNYNLNK